MRHYVVVLGAESDARFRDVHVPMVLGKVTTAVGAVDLTFRTRYADEGYESSVPREMWIDARGETDDGVSLPEAIDAYVNATAPMLPMIALATNAWVDDVAPKLAYDATPGLSEREFFTNFVGEERNTLPSTRRIVDVPATLAFIGAAARSPDSARLHRATTQYALGLRHSTPGNETMALAHFFIGMEALTPIARRRELAGTGCTAEELAAAWEIGDSRKLDAEIRRRVLFRADDATATKARKASDGLEHAFLEFVKVRELAEEVVEKTATYLREAIIDYSGIDDAKGKTLKSPPFDRALRSYYARYLWGEIVGEGEELAQPGQEYPVITWKSGLKSCAIDPEDADRYVMEAAETMNVRFAEGLTFRRRRWEIYGAAASGATAGTEDDDGEVSP